MTQYIRFLLLGGLFFFMPLAALASDPLPPQIPIPGQITLVDLGSHSCIPCKMMAPILEKLTKDYNGKAAIIFIDVWANKEQAKHFKVSAIPTQIFFDTDGKEVYRHQGFMAEEDIVHQFTTMGVTSPDKD